MPAASAVVASPPTEATPIASAAEPSTAQTLEDTSRELIERTIAECRGNLSSAARGDMLHLKNSATHQKQSGTLSVALRILGSRYSREVTLADLTVRDGRVGNIRVGGSVVPTLRGRLRLP